MSRSSAPVLASPRLLLPLLLFLMDVSSAQTATNSSSGTTDIGCSVKICAALDVALLQEYVTGLLALNGTDQRPIELSTNESLLPFGALASDWTRLMLLQNRQPEGSPLRDNLLRLSRLVLAAYFDSQDGENITTTISNSDSLDSTAAPESEDQQANNVTVDSTAQKESSSGAYSGEEELADTAAAAVRTSAENFAGNDGEDSTPTSYYVDSTLANFNQAFSTLVSLDNEANGSKSNETLLGDNEDESTTESWLESFSSTAWSGLLDSESGFASSPSESSRVNEAIHARSKEDFLISRYASKESRLDSDASESDNDDDLVARFFAEEHDGEADVSASKNSMEDLLALIELEELEERENASTSAPSPYEPEDSLEFNVTKSLEALLDSMDELNDDASTTSVNFELAATQNSSESSEVTTMPPSLINGSGLGLEEIIEESSTLNFQDSSTFGEPPIVTGSASSDNSSDASASSEESLDELIELLDEISAEDIPPPSPSPSPPTPTTTTTTTTTTTQLVQMISGKLSSESSYSNEVTTENGRTDRSGEYSDTTLPSLPATTDKASSENHTSHPDDVLFKETRAMTSVEGVPDDWSTTNSYEAAAAAAAEPHHRSRKILMIFRHGEHELGGSGNKLKEVEEKLSSRSTKVASREKTAFNPASLRNRLDREPEIAGMNKPKRRAAGGGVELLDVERQYRTFRAEPGQTPYAEKRSDEEEGAAAAAAGRWLLQ